MAWRPAVLLLRWSPIRGRQARPRRLGPLALPTAVAMAAALLTGVVGWRWHAEEALRTLRREQADTAMLRAALRQADAGPDRLARLQQAHEEARRRLALAEQDWRTEDMQALLVRLHGAASAAQVRIELLRQHGGGQARPGVPVALSVQVAGGYQAVLQWIGRLGAWPEGIAIENLEWSPSGDKGGGARLTLTLRCFLNGPPDAADDAGEWHALSRVVSQYRRAATQAGPGLAEREAAGRQGLPDDIGVESLRLYGTIRSGRAAAALLLAGGDLFLAREGQRLDRRGARVCRIAAQEVDVCEAEAGRGGREEAKPGESDPTRHVLRLESPA